MTLKLCDRCRIMKKIRGKKILCKKCEEEFDNENKKTNKSRFNVKEDRKIIKNIIYKNLSLISMTKNKEAICQDLADAILVYLIEKMKNSHVETKGQVLRKSSRNNNSL